MSGRTGGRVPSIITNVHQRSLSRSSGASGSVPNSPKTHEFIHLDDELASKQSLGSPVSATVAETKPEGASNGVPEPIVAEKPVEDTIKTLEEPEQVAEAHEQLEMVSDAAISAQDEAAPVSPEDDTTVPTAEDLAVTPEASQATQAGSAEPLIEKATPIDVSEPEAQVPSDMPSATVEDTPAHDGEELAKEEVTEIPVVEESMNDTSAVVPEESHEAQAEETAHEDVVVQPETTPAAVEIATPEVTDEAPATTSEEPVAPAVETSETSDEIEATPASDEPIAVSEPAVTEVQEETQPGPSEEAKSEEPTLDTPAVSEVSEPTAEEKPVEAAVEEAASAPAEEKPEDFHVSAPAELVQESSEIIEDAGLEPVKESEVTEVVALADEPSTQAETQPLETVEPATVEEPVTESIPAVEEKDEDVLEPVAPAPEEQTAEGVVVADVPEATPADKETPIEVVSATEAHEEEVPESVAAIAELEEHTVESVADAGATSANEEEPIEGVQAVSAPDDVPVAVHVPEAEPPVVLEEEQVAEPVVAVVDEPTEPTPEELKDDQLTPAIAEQPQPEESTAAVADEPRIEETTPAAEEVEAEPEEVAKPETTDSAAAADEPSIASKICCGEINPELVSNSGLILLSTSTETCFEHAFEPTAAATVENGDAAPVAEVKESESEVAGEDAPATQDLAVDEAAAPESSVVVDEVVAIVESTDEATSDVTQPEASTDEAVVPTNVAAVVEEEYKVEAETEPETAVTDKEVNEADVSVDAPVEVPASTEPSSASEAIEETVVSQDAEPTSASEKIEETVVSQDAVPTSVNEDIEETVVSQDAEPTSASEEIEETVAAEPTSASDEKLEEAISTQDVEHASTDEVKVEDVATEDSQVAAPEIAVTVSEDDAASTDVAPVEEPERPKSPWMASYSVTSQGPGITEESIEHEVADAPASEEPNEPEIPEVAVEGATATAPDEAVAHPWPVSYAVSSQGNSPMHKPVELSEPVEPIQDLQLADTKETVGEEVAAPVEEFVPEEAKIPEVVIEVESDVAVEEGEATSEAVIEPPTIVTPDEEPSSEAQETVETAELEEQRPPSRPWTPSYSVARQGSSPALAQKELESEPSVEPIAVAEEPESVSADAPIAQPVPQKAWVSSYSVSRQGSKSSLVATDEPNAAEPEEVVEQVTESPAPVVVTSEPESEPTAAAEDVPTAPAERPWTPSYSVSRQGSKSSLVSTDEPKAAEPEEVVEQVPESPAPVVVTSEPESEPTATAEDVPAAPAERPWTPSYSVSRQGSRSSLRVESKPTENDQVDGAAAAVVITSEPEAQEVTAADEAKASWTPSYSVSRQGSRSSLVDKEESKLEEPEQAVTVSEPAAPVIITPDVVAIEETKVEAAAVLEAPARPWTPSYSVSRQGSSPVPSPKVETVELPVEQTPPQRPWTPSYSVSRQGSSSQLATKAAVDEVSLPVASPAEETATETPVISVDSAPAVVVSEPETTASEETPASEQPERPWTPSYSVTTQGPASPSQDADASTEPQAFPTTEVTEHGPKVTTEPSLARLAPVNENEQANPTSPADLDSLSPTASTARTRHESTTSSQSRMLPGGWVSGAKSLEDNRASLDHAAGEFSKNKPAESETPAQTGAVAADGHHHHQKKKHRMCIIM